MAQAMTRIALALGATLLLASACAEPPPPAANPPPHPRPAPAPQPEARDECGASDYRDLVGQPRSKIPVPVDPGLQRVACTTCPVTMDYNPRRLNFFFDAETGLIHEVRCG